MIVALVTNKPDTPTTYEDAIECMKELLSAWEDGRCSISLSRRAKASIAILENEGPKPTPDQLQQPGKSPLVSLVYYRQGGGHIERVTVVDGKAAVDPVSIESALHTIAELAGLASRMQTRMAEKGKA